MFSFIKERYFGLLDDLDFLSSQVRRHTYDFGPLITPRSANKPGQSRTRWAGAIEAFIVFVLLAALATYSRMAQFDAMTQQLTDYFLPGLLNVSTTHDAGYYLSQAKKWSSLLAEPGTALLPPPGELPGFILAHIAVTLEISLEQAGRLLVYASVTLTAFSAYLLLAANKQSALGLFTAVALVFFFPIYSRTSLGMIDTDQLNLFFVLAVLAALRQSVACNRTWLAMTLLGLAGLLSYSFYLWYPRPGFALMFLLTYLLVSLSYRLTPRRITLGLTTFSVLSGPSVLAAALPSLQSFLGVYLLGVGGPEHRAVQQSQGLTTESLLSTMYSTISEIQPLSLATVTNDYGSVATFGALLVGLMIWLLQDWRRGLLTLPLIAFLYLYFAAGQRFSFYAAPLLVLGGPVLIFSVVQMLRSTTRLSRLGDTTDGPKESSSTSQSIRTMAPTLQLGALAVILGLAFKPFEILPPAGTIPPPVIPASELKSLEEVRSKSGTTPYLIASWWDYGHELRYQGAGDVLVDGNNPASIRVLYVARALVSKDPYFAADELRFAAYFTPSDLEQSYPKRPQLTLASRTDHDIYLFLPSELQHKMRLILGIASMTMSKAALADYHASESVFFNLYHRTPARLGPFELVHSTEGGAKLYKLPAPVMPNSSSRPRLSQ